MSNKLINIYNTFLAVSNNNGVSSTAVVISHKDNKYICTNLSNIDYIFILTSNDDMPVYKRIYIKIQLIYDDYIKLYKIDQEYKHDIIPFANSKKLLYDNFIVGFMKSQCFYINDEIYKIFTKNNLYICPHYNGSIIYNKYANIDILYFSALVKKKGDNIIKITGFYTPFLHTENGVSKHNIFYRYKDIIEMINGHYYKHPISLLPDYSGLNLRKINFDINDNITCQICNIKLGNIKKYYLPDNTMGICECCKDNYYYKANIY